MKKIKAFRIDEELYNKFKIYVIKNNTTISKEIENFMKQKINEK